MAELLGTHSYSLDPKGRVSLPAKFREAFDEGLWLTMGQDRCLYCFPRAEWERRSSEVDAFALSDKDGRAFSRLFFSSADEVRLDGAGTRDDPAAAPRRGRDQEGGRGPRRARAHGDLGPRGVRAVPGCARGRIRERGPGAAGACDVEARRKGPAHDGTRWRSNRARRGVMQTKLSTEVRQSLSLLGDDGADAARVDRSRDLGGTDRVTWRTTTRRTNRRWWPRSSTSCSPGGRGPGEWSPT